MQNDLRQLRLKAGLTQKQIAEALGVPLSTYRRWDKGSSEGTERYERQTDGNSGHAREKCA